VEEMMMQTDVLFNEASRLAPLDKARLLDLLFNSFSDTLQQNHEHDGLGYEFVNELLATTERIKHYPNAWTQLSKRTRRCLMHRFPYAVIFRLVKSTQEVQIIDLMHQKQKPRYALS